MGTKQAKTLYNTERSDLKALGSDDWLQETLDQHWAGTKNLEKIKRANQNIYKAQNKNVGKAVVKVKKFKEGLLQAT